MTCEVAPHHFLLTDEHVGHYDTHCKMNPPLRSAADRDAMLEAIMDGVVDCIATDHAPHASHEKEVEFEFMNMESKASTTISMGGLITNEDMESIVDVQIVVKDNSTGELLKTYTTSSDVGYYYLVLDRGRNYNI